MNPLAPALAARFEARFRELRDSRMADVPLLHRDVPVRMVLPSGPAIPDQRGYGVLVTPWFMNLVAAPATTDATVHAELPGGAVTLERVEDEVLGPWLRLALFSPLLEFEDGASALATAESVLAGLAGAPATPPPPAALSRRSLLLGLRRAEPAA